MSDINIDPGLRPNERPGSRDLVGELQEKFPFEAFKTDNPDSANPLLYLEDPWRFSFFKTIETASDDVTIASKEAIYFIEFTRQATSKTITLPDAALITGQMLIIKAIGVGVGAVVLDGNGSQTINGSTTITMKDNADNATLYSDGSNWKSSHYTPPIGFTYMQLPNKAAPADLYPFATWTNVSSTFAGDFFRAEGGDASAFEAGEQDDAFQDHIHNERGTLGTTNTVQSARGTGNSVNGTSAGYASSAATRNQTETTGAAVDVGGALGTPRVDTETRPINHTIRIWERTA